LSHAQFAVLLILKKSFEDRLQSTANTVEPWFHFRSKAVIIRFSTCLNLLGPMVWEWKKLYKDNFPFVLYDTFFR